jgi:hypothetical protein
VGLYVFLLLVVLLFVSRSSSSSSWWVTWVLVGAILLLLARYLSTTYRIDDTELRAWRIFGGRRLRLNEVNRIEYASLRDLSPGGTFLGGWGWRGRLWSPRIGLFDAVHTDAALGLLVSGSGVPLYFSPRNPEAFARELSRRVRSYSGRLAADVGDPLGGPPIDRI